MPDVTNSFSAIVRRVFTSAPVVWAAGCAVVSYGNATLLAFLFFTLVAAIKLAEAVTDKSFGLSEGVFASADGTAAITTLYKAIVTGAMSAYVMAASFACGAAAMGVNAFNVFKKRTPRFVIDRPDFYNALGNTLMVLFQGIYLPVPVFVCAFLRSIVEDMPNVHRRLPVLLRDWLKPSILNGLGWLVATCVNAAHGETQFAAATLLWSFGYFLDKNYGGPVTAAFLARLKR